MGDKSQQHHENGPEKLNLSSLSLSTVSVFAATLLISIFFIDVAKPFLIPLILAGICAALARPFYLKILALVGGREGPASGLTLLIGIILVIVPMLCVAYLAGTQASVVIADSSGLLEVLSEDVNALKAGTLETPEWLPYGDELENAGPQLYEKATELLSKLASFLVSSLAHVTNGTASFFVGLFTFLYAMFFFLPMKRSVFEQVLAYSGLPHELQSAMSSKIISVSRATIKGSLVIGVIQGALGGMGFWLAGFDGAVFWAVIMMILAAVPAVGATPIVIGGAIYLGFSGETVPAIALGLWGGLVVGTIDNVLRPRLVGRDAQMSDLWIFVSTLGGLAAFGAAGLVLGPVLAGLLITVWGEFSDAADEGPTEPETDTAPASDPPQERNPEFKLTASKADLEKEVEELRQDFHNRDS
ncbi:AI-2E family transporter [Shimia thalassica]|uniref:AI-2E family transporter n=1 Tax=Shimia thalassica TaxID=1715693 RepID=UPI0026E44CAD|nr:AI-2E family transporter [Shimia thalassica]MDO6480126.1 AI-2E family transporter [Shimia thalassica]